MRKTRIILMVLLTIAALAEMPVLARAATSGWTVQSTPNHGGAAGLNSVWCGSSSACVAVGSTQIMFGPKITRTLTEVWNGQSWTQTTTTLGVLEDVSCWSANGCLAVGYVKSEPLTERWDGSSWTILKSANAKTGVGGFDAVSCWAANRCMETGSYIDGTHATSSPFGVLVEEWNGRSWKPLSTPHVGESELKDVSCWSGSGCVAVGYGTSGFETLGLAEVWDGRVWKVQKTPNPETWSPGSVSCWSSRGCVAVGSANVRNSGYVFTDAEVWNGHSWSRHRIPVRAETGLSDVSCTSRFSCVAVGRDASDPGQPITEAWNGRSWATSAMPAVPDDDGFLEGVSCWSTTGCTSVGVQNLGIDINEPLAETFGPSAIPAT